MALALAIACGGGPDPKPDAPPAPAPTPAADPAPAPPPAPPPAGNVPSVPGAGARFGEPGIDDDALGVARLPSGQILVAGDGGTFGGQPPAAWHWHGFLAWLGRDLRLERADDVGSSTGTIIEAVATSVDASIAIVGWDGAAGGGSHGVIEVRDAGGGLLWHLQTSLDAQVLAAAFTAGGDVVTGGRAPGGVDAAAPDAKGPWVARYGAGGSLVWRTMLGADYRGWVRSVAISASDDVYAVGQSEAGPFVARLLRDGTVAWLTALPIASAAFPSGQGSDRYIGAESVAADPHGGAYVAATTSEAWIARVDAGGAIRWSRTIAKDQPWDLNWGRAVAAYPGGGAVLVGARGGVFLSVFMSPGARPYAARFSEGGDALWTVDLPVGAPGSALAASVDPDDGVLVAGSVLESAPDPSGHPMPAGPRDAFVVQVGRDGSVR